jgi:hypothetical protein
MIRMLIVLAIVALAGCRGEPVPRDYQNAPPAMMHPATSQDETPAHHGLGQGSPEPSSGVEGTIAPHEPVFPPAGGTTTTMPDTPPTST